MPINNSVPDRAYESDDRVQPDSRPYITAYVDRLKESGVLNEPAVEQAFRRVPRHLFVERFFVGDEEKGWTPVEHDPTRPTAEHLEMIYSGAALITRLEGNLPTSSTSQPGLVADMLQLLELRPGMRVLEIGAGTGYNAALMAELVGDPGLVVTIDIQEDVVEDARRSLTRAGYPGIRVLCQDGFEGAPEAAPFDRIVATVGCPDISPQWVKQLAPSGSMLVPLRHVGANPLVRAWREGGEVIGSVVGSSGFMAIQGKLWDEHYLDFSQPRRNGAEEERSVWPELATAKSLQNVRESNQSRTAFWFFLGLRDRRTRLFRWFSSFGLEDKPSGRTARLEADRLVGDPTLLDELDALYREWQALGAPDIRRFRLRFVPAHSSDRAASPQAARPEAGASGQHIWTMPGPFYWREFSLNMAQSAHSGPTRPSPAGGSVRPAG
jgi:protein-L-isoaspartate(D-aspartate) O-methyltransferase